MKKSLTALLITVLVCANVFAKPVRSSDQAVDMVMKSVVENKLTSLKLNCLSFFEADENAEFYSIDVREKHDKKCGGDPETAPRLMSYEVEKKSGKLCTDSIEWAERLQAKDPHDFQCRPIK